MIRLDCYNDTELAETCQCEKAADSPGRRSRLSPNGKKLRAAGGALLPDRERGNLLRFPHGDAYLRDKLVGVAGFMGQTW